jgi:hypothetical protein
MLIALISLLGNPIKILGIRGSANEQSEENEEKSDQAACLVASL